jgi:hypothetical protein
MKDELGASDEVALEDWGILHSPFGEAGAPWHARGMLHIRSHTIGFRGIEVGVAGMLISSPWWPRVGELTFARFRLAGEPLGATARVVKHDRTADESRTALLFIDLDPEVRAKLSDYVAWANEAAKAEGGSADHSTSATRSPVVSGPPAIDFRAESERSS